MGLEKLEHVSNIIDSLHKTPKYNENGYPMVRVTDIKGGYLDLSDTKKVSKEVYEEFTKRYKPQRGDIVFSRVGSYGNSCFVKENQEFCLGQNTIVISPNIDSYYLYYTLNSPFIKNQIEALVGGASQPTISLKNINNLKIPLPSANIQKKIGSILSAYDDLIKNNIKRIQILKEMASRVYREWFVHFGFPGHKNVKMVDSELGMIPNGWEVKKLGDQIELAYGKGLKASDRKEGPVPVYGSGGIVGNHDEALVAGPGIVVGRKGNVGSVHWSDHDFFPIDTTFFIKTELPLLYIYYNLKHQNFINTDAAVPGLNRNLAYLNEFLLPDRDVLDLFQNLINPIFAQLKNLTEKNNNLCQTRDLLLPRLISGQIDVSDLSIDIEANEG